MKTALLLQGVREPYEMKVGAQFLAELARETYEGIRLYRAISPEQHMREVMRSAVRGDLLVFGVRIEADFRAGP